MILKLIGHTYKYECEKVLRLFFPTAKIEFAAQGAALDPSADTVVCERAETPAGTVYRCRAHIDGRTAAAERPGTDADAVIEENPIATVMVEALKELTGVMPPWGILTGVRPSKLMRKLLASDGDAAERIFTDTLLVRPDKASLARRVADAEEAAVRLSLPDSFSLYIAVPFCPSRCSYCSFVSHSVAQAKKLIPSYVQRLCEEIDATALLAEKLGLRLETVYIGGGTPTVLEPSQLEDVCAALRRGFALDSAREFTVEAGRPDTVTPEKLAVLKSAGVGRISINPQTFSDEVLAAIGRRHTVADIYDRFALARAAGFDNINMDLIAGLPGDTPEGFAKSLSAAVGLAPENITVHTLALKRAAALSLGEAAVFGSQTAAMLDTVSSALPQAGYAPYYMYRQSKSVGNLENVGWTKPGRECLYNIYMMEEVHSVFACGAGAVSKAVSPQTGFITRYYNFKYPYEYLSRFSEVLERKQNIAAFYREEKD